MPENQEQNSERQKILLYVQHEDQHTTHLLFPKCIVVLALRVWSHLDIQGGRLECPVHAVCRPRSGHRLFFPDIPLVVFFEGALGPRVPRLWYTFRTLAGVSVLAC